MQSSLTPDGIPDGGMGQRNHSLFGSLEFPFPHLEVGKNPVLQPNYFPGWEFHLLSPPGMSPFYQSGNAKNGYPKDALNKGIGKTDKFKLLQEAKAKSEKYY